ncbi:MAG: ATPase, T2SS/T4P/T4SS family, partial [Candidatus Gracilibacteria bacterium]|nr:ATPase, T2SS/T4P/T4SS family [Candidatus Gracilibacteria bacterium]
MIGLNKMNLQGDHQSIGSVLSGLNDEFKEQEVAEKAKELGLGYINLTKISINMDFLSLVTKQESKSASLIPYFGVGRKIRLAITNLQNPNIKLIIDRLKEQEYEVAISLCSDESMAHAQQSYTSDLHFEKKEIIADDSQKAESLDQEIELIRQIPQKIGNLKGEEALNLLHIEVLKLKASDVHFEPQKNKTLKVRARIDGVLIEFFTLDQDKAVDMVRTVKHLAKLKLNIDYLPQDGKYTFDATDRAVDVRVSTLPVKNGESIVMRFLDSKKSILNVDDLGFSVKAYADFKKSLASTNGIILSTGPTGSGKTTTLHSALSYINTPDKKIVTVEDPVEFQIPGIVQCEINADKGLTFASGLRSILRQDPNVVMIGEIRDQETAETAI